MSAVVDGPLAQYPFAEACAGLAPEWLSVLEAPAAAMDPAYLASLRPIDWLPGPQLMLAPLHKVAPGSLRALLIGESPYPRRQSAIGEAFNDGAVGSIWSGQGLATPVNKATSLRNIMKMLLVADGLVSPAATAAEIAAVDRSGLVVTLEELFARIRAAGILCFNAIPVLTANKARDARQWLRFMDLFLGALHRLQPQATLLLFGNFAKDLGRMDGAAGWRTIAAEHPYNVSFINDPTVLDFFRPLRLLHRP